MIERERIDVVVPTCEEVFYVGRFKTLLSERAQVFCPDIDSLRSLHSKWEFASLVERAAGFGSIVQAPESWRITGGADISTLPAPSDQLVFKPVYSRFAVETLIRPKARTAARDLAQRRAAMAGAALHRRPRAVQLQRLPGWRGAGSRAL